MSQTEIQFTPVETGNMSEIPPDAPEGHWIASFRCKVAATSKDKFPMVIIDARLEEALTEGNENHVGAKVSEFIVFFPANHNASKMSRVRLQAICGALKIDLPTFTVIRSSGDLASFTEAIETNKAQVWTKHEADKVTGEVRTKLLFTAPRGSAEAFASSSNSDVNEEATPKRRRSR
jgi:hypothetical protein